MKSKKDTTKEASVIKRSKLEPPYDAGDCGYYAVCVGLLHLGMQAKTDEKLAATINNSQMLSTVFSHMPKISRITGANNVQTLENILTELNATGWDSLSFKEILSEFSDGIRSSLVASDWGVNYFKAILREGAWVLDHQKWMDLPPFKRLNGKILDRMVELANGKDVDIDKAGELRFQATLEIFKELEDTALKSMATAVITKHYGPRSAKAWVDDEFLRYFSKLLFPNAENVFFDPKGIEITSKGPSTSHWYIDVPKNDTTDSLLKTVNSGSSKDLKEIEVYRVKDKHSDNLSTLIKEHEELLKAQQQLITTFKDAASGLYAKYLDSSLAEGLSALSYFDKEPPTQETIDNALIPIIAADETSTKVYTELSMTRKSIADMNEKIKKVEKELELRKDKTSISSLISSGLSLQTSKEKHGNPKARDEIQIPQSKDLSST
ncbi:hypothetical protein [Legionella lansingensis]|uniref:Uncharacterized protein n=1 Tax=Legionella lansingensis TaxID=45067 RepID=A0A0W0VRR1_9GAMM|nr:hypothetical protein [Legionella lansingensis]KTD22830.1 hypothetical protein Llan_1071 [Legionella lansingensis]